MEHPAPIFTGIHAGLRPKQSGEIPAGLISQHLTHLIRLILGIFQQLHGFFHFYSGDILDKTFPCLLFKQAAQIGRADK